MMPQREKEDRLCLTPTLGQTIYRRCVDEGTPISMILDTIVSVMIRCVKRLLRLNFVGKTCEKIFVENNQKNSFFANDKKVVR